MSELAKETAGRWELEMAGRWVDNAERTPEKYGKYRVMRKYKSGGTLEDCYLWNGSYWVTNGGSPSKGVTQWFEEGAAAEQAGENLPAQTAGEQLPASLAMYEARIQLYKEQAVTGYIGIGRTLNEAKAAGVVPHGEWESWVERTTGLNIRQAQRCMKAASEIREGSFLGQIDMSKAMLLLSSGLDEEQKEALAEKTAGEGSSIRELKAEIARLQGKAEEAAENVRVEKNRELQTLEEQWNAERTKWGETMDRIADQREAENEENRKTVQALKLQVVESAGAAAEIREKLKETERQKAELIRQMQALDKGMKERMDEEVGRAYQRGLTDKATGLEKEIRQEVANEVSVLKNELNKQTQYAAELQKSLKEAEEANQDQYNLGKDEGTLERRALTDKVDDLLEERERLKAELKDAREKSGAEDMARQIQQLKAEAERKAAEAYERGKKTTAEQTDVMSRRLKDLEQELAASEERAANKARELSELRKEKAKAGMNAVRGLRLDNSTSCIVDLAAAVRSFMGAVGAMPQMGNLLDGVTEKDREGILAQVETIARWVAGTRQALGMTVAEASIQ